ncbi:response regulator [Cupriavidus sp. AU9028]|uniref:response regulator n=1 Tax=Cupriavidus sp. AU9028 TaxID=2871157 RepID=UPI001C969162|nr:response regulator [Cupriavidus sp. AU9028]MBY4899050.1 response regulator [Cupriavidus sp. AU9028]
MTLLLVEDDPISAYAVSLALRKHGYVVEVAEDGLSGFEQARRLHPDVIVTDWLMPNADGAALCAMLMDDTALRETPVVIHTSLAAVPQPPNPVVRCCRKPCSPDDLVELIEDAMAERRQRAERREPGRR